MKVFVVYIGDIFHCPPAMTVIQTLSDLKYEVHVCVNSFSAEKTVESFSDRKNVKFVSVANEYNRNQRILGKFLEMLQIRKRLWDYIDGESEKDSLIWIVAGGTVKFLGKELLNHKYILHLLELTEDIYYLESKHMFPLSRKYARKATVVVECEYNRAHITKAWWELETLPEVLPNKPYIVDSILKNSSITSNDNVVDVIKAVKGKKVILYQGNISAERPLEPFIEAVEELGDPYVFVAMVNGDDPFPNKKRGSYYHIPFVVPPYHLEVTSNAYIGVLTYTPIKNDYSILNTLYCAPNKIWEYSMFSIPMISNDLPALKELFMSIQCGVCFDKFTKEQIKDAIVRIDSNYSDFANESKRLFESVDINNRIQHIIDCAKER